MFRYIPTSLIVLAAPIVAYAATAQQTIGLVNPLKVDSVQGFLLAVLDIGITFAIPIITLVIMYSGFMMVMAQGDPGKLTAAKKRLYAAIGGGLVILGAEFILQVIKSTVDSLVK